MFSKAHRSFWLTIKNTRVAAGSETRLVRYFHPLTGFPDQRLHGKRVSPGAQTLHLSRRPPPPAPSSASWLCPAEVFSVRAHPESPKEQQQQQHRRETHSLCDAA